MPYNCGRRGGGRGRKSNTYVSLSRLVVAGETKTMSKCLTIVDDAAAAVAGKVIPKFQVGRSPTLRVTVRTKIKYENQQRAITQKVKISELWFLGTALLLNAIYPYMKFQVDRSYTLRVMVRTKV